jgi:diguanylate cyclase (GGDEF)-like protein
VDTTGIPEPAGWEDPLTGLQGPDFWQRSLIAEVARSARYRRSLTVVVVEVNGIEPLGELWGWDVARSAIREAAQCLRRASRTSDLCSRIGPTRFGVTLTETDEIAAINFVERVREAGPRAMPKGADGLQFSFGWASPRQGESAAARVRRAESRLAVELAEA